MPSHAHLRFPHVRRLRPAAPIAAVAALAFTGCGAVAAVQTQTNGVAVASTASIDRMTTVAKAQYLRETSGGKVRGLARQIANDPGVRGPLRSGDMPRLRAYVRSKFSSVWYHQHVSRLRILRGSKVEVDAGVPFVVAPAKTTLRDRGGRPIGTVEVSIQDLIGFVRYMHRNYPVDVVVRGTGPRHTRTSLPAALRVHLPDRGVATVRGHRYNVRSFMASALGGEPVRISILQRG